MNDPDLLTELTEIELSALSKCALSSEHQARLSLLLAHNREQVLTAQESQELDRYLQEVDALSILKARAQLTLQHWDDLDDVSVRRDLAAASVAALGDFWDNEVDLEWQNFQP